MYGRVTGRLGAVQRLWASMETYIIPTPADQPTNSFYNPADPATTRPKPTCPSDYPSPISSTVPVGSDPIGAASCRRTYGTDVYGMHWLLDVDNIYGYGRRGDGTRSRRTSTPSSAARRSRCGRRCRSRPARTSSGGPARTAS